MTQLSEEWWATVDAALSVGQQIAPTKEDLNTACEHVARLLKDAAALLELGSHATAAFLSITAIEETAKVHVGMYRRSAQQVGRRKDPLYKHDQKHKLGLGPTVSMGGRLKAAVGEDRVLELTQLARSGELVALREAALYVEQKEQGLVVPAVAITPRLSLDLLLLAIEAFDDALVGYTNRSFELGAETDQLFERWAKAGVQP